MKSIEKDNITKLTSIKEIKRQSIKRKHNRAFTIQKTNIKTKKHVIIQKDEKLLKTKKRDIVLND
jgi:hypothetical protein